jgi:hypothetical protein
MLRRSARIVAAGLFAAALTLGGTVAAQAAAGTTVTLSASTATANGQLTLTADGYLPGEPLTLTLDSSPVQTYAASGYTQGVADGSGRYVATVYLPGAVTVGAHTLFVAGTMSAMTSTPMGAPITIVPQPTSLVTPATVGLTAYLSKGVTVTFSGFTPGDTVSFGLGDQGSGGPVGSSVTVGASGTATLSYVPTAGAQYSSPGTYTFSAGTAAGSRVAQPATLTVTADPVVAPVAPVAAPAAPVKQTASFTG